MLLQLGLAAGLIAATIAIQAVFMSIGLREFNSLAARRPDLVFRTPTLVTVIWVLFFIVPIVTDVLLWVTAYRLQGALPSFEDAMYFSTVTFTTVGYGDIVLGREWRQLATFEAMNGLIIFGWVTALIIAVIERLQRRPDLGQSQK